MEDNTLRLTALKPLLTSTGVFAASGVLTVILSALAAYLSPDPDALRVPLGIASLLLSSLISGFAAARASRNEPLPTAVYPPVAGVVNVLLLILLRLVPAGEAESSRPFIALAYAADIAVCVIGGMIGTPRHRGVRRRRRR